MLEVIGILSGLIALYAAIPYVKDILRGNTKPQRMAWVLFTSLSIISFFAQVSAGATNSLWFPGVLLASSLVIFALTLKYGMGGYEKFDILCLFLALGVAVVWVTTKSAALAIICSVGVNTIGKVLVTLKVYKHPHSEYLPTWIWSVVASVLSMISVGKLDWILLLPATQNAVTVGAIAILIYYRRKKVSIPKKQSNF